VCSSDLGVRASDHAVFYARNIPVLFLFTGMIKEYHRPTDTADREDAPGIVEVARWARLAAEAAADADPRPVFTPLKEAGPPTRAYLGISPDNAAESDGVHVNAVVPGGPAEHAGIRVGDVIVRIRETPVQGIDDLHGVLAGLKPDEEVEVTLRRDGTTETVRVRLGRAPDER
jgi:predicted metalloprotease with PDZ domain